MKYLTAHEFKILSDSEKAEYYDSLHDEKIEAVTCEQKTAVAVAYEAISDYGDSAEFANDLRSSAAKQKEADAKYISEKRKKGALAILGVLAVAVIIVIAAVIAAMI